MRRARTRGAVSAGVLIACLAGCVSERNERLTIGTRPTASFATLRGPSMIGPGTLDRTRWRTLVVVAPIDGVVHSEPFRLPPIVGRRAGPDRAGVFPSPGPEPKPVVGGWGVTLGELGRSVFDPLLAPGRAWRARRTGWWTWSPIKVWKRTRSDGARSASVGGVRRESNDE